MSAQLCYVDNGRAYFTTQALDKQWGDDWDDAPYEHNAGTPYESEDKLWEIVEIHFTGNRYVTPDDCVANSPYSVMDMNSGAIAWLRDDRDEHPPIMAGCSIEEFKQKIRAAGGKIWDEESQVPA